MKIIRCKIWYEYGERHDGVALTDEAKAHYPPGTFDGSVPDVRYISQFNLRRDGDGVNPRTECVVDIFHPAKDTIPVIAFIKPDAPDWAEAAIRQEFDERGKRIEQPTHV